MNSSQVLHLMISGIRSYARQNGFKKAVIGLSGGIDSALTCSLAVQALGKKNVTVLLLPSPFTNPENMKDAKEICKNLGIAYKTYSIHRLLKSYLREIDFLSSEFSLAEENLQARIRGNILMSYSNKYHALVLNTGNKSEALTGYFTLYGDSCGGLAVLANLYKTQVYEISAQYNLKFGSGIPFSVFQKLPTAELRKNQSDEADLLPYPLLDSILKLYFDQNKTVNQIVKKGFKKKDVEKVVRWVEKSKFKRKQLPPALNW
ncbi:MAG: NAD(+) synthase [Candidatus Diapherotrites archaeon]|nr:NAD(+) synthase [Candidatus Diapherotrites archaeon]